MVAYAQDGQVAEEGGGQSRGVGGDEFSSHTCPPARHPRLDAPVHQQRRARGHEQKGPSRTAPTASARPTPTSPPSTTAARTCRYDATLSRRRARIPPCPGDTTCTRSAFRGLASGTLRYVMGSGCPRLNNSLSPVLTGAGG